MSGLAYPLKGQATALGGKKRNIPLSAPYTFPPGSYNFTPPYAGRWKFVAWSGGGLGSSGDGGSSGTYAEITKVMSPGEAVSISVGYGGNNTIGDATDTTITFADGKTVTCPAGVAGGGGVPSAPSGGDVNLSASAGGAGGGSGATGGGTGGGSGGAGSGAVGGGGGAPANLPFRGGKGAGSGANGARSPGGGGAGNSGTAQGGDGLVVAFMV